jgi:alpha-tubulin suppressor-like RCC1 family protein
VTVKVSSDAPGVLVPVQAMLLVPAGATTGRVALRGVALGAANMHASATGYADATLPVQVSDHVVSIATNEISAGLGSVCTLRAGGATYCWGWNLYGEAGPDLPGGASLARPLSTAPAFTAIAGGITACGLTAAGSASCWGYDASGQLGNGATAAGSTPGPVPVSGGFSFARIAVGWSSACGLTPAGAVYCWGDNSQGQVGDSGPVAPRLTPAAVAGGHTFKDVVVGPSHACALTTGGEAYCWGSNGGGKLGDGTTTTQVVPTPVTGGLHFVQLSAGLAHTCGLTAAGAAYCWGDNSHGGLGTGTTVSSGTPVAVQGGLTFTSLSVASFTTCGLAAGGTAYCWGQNPDGELGDGSTADRPTPGAVSGGLVFRSLSAGSSFACGVTTTDEIWCWGQDANGQLGDGQTAHRTTPSRVTPGGVPVRLSFAVQPTTTQAGQLVTPPVQVAIQDGFGAAASTPDTVVLWLHYVTSGPTNHYDQDGFAAVVNGVATFPSVTAPNPGTGYTFVLRLAPPGTSGDLTPCGFGNPPTCGAPILDQSAPFDVTAPPVPMTVDIPGPDLIGLGLTNPLDVTLSQPAGPGGVTLTVTSSDASLLTAADPGTVLIPEGQTTGRIVLNGLALGSATVHVGAPGYVSASLPVHVTDVVNAVVQDSLSAGVFGTCAIRPSGSLYCWGHATPPTRLVTALGFVAVSAGDTHQCALRADGTAYCWGDNSLGQLGDGSLTPSPTPVAVAGNLRFARIRAGQGYTCGLTIGGGVYCWGDSAHVGRLGLFISNSALVPTAVIGGQTFADLSLDPTFHACALTTGGEAYCWGANGYGDIGDGTQIPRTVPTAVHAGGARFQAIAAGGGDVVGPFTCALTAAGEVYCWGSNVNGELGLNPASLFSAWIPVRSAAGPYVSLAVGGGSVCAITAAGTAECWGRNLTGQLGDGTNSDRFTPTPVPGVAFGRISVGTYHTCGASTTGGLWCWGSNQSGQLGAFLGNPATHPAPVKVNPGPPAALHITGPASAVAGQTIAPAVTVSAKDAFGDVAGVGASPVTIALGANPGSATLGGTTTATVSGGAAAFASLTIGAAGSGYTLVASYPGIPADTSAPFTVTVPVNVTAVPLSAGVSHACEIRSGGAVWCWGGNAAGQLGDGTTGDASLPVQVAAAPSFVAVSAGDDHTCALTSAGAAYCWGGNGVGQLGNGGTGTGLTPTAVAGGLAFVQILAGSGFTCGLTAAGSAYCWGGNGGKLGDGNPASNPLSPQAVVGGLTFTALSLFGNNHACGLEVGGKAYCWGYNYDGELGDGTQSDRYVPTAVAGVGYYSKIAAATFHSCALTATGAAFCWGDNNVSQLGWGSPPTDQYSPGAVGGGYVFASLAAGGGHTCGLQSSGAAICWGYNAEGALGDGTQNTRVNPAPVSGGMTFARLALGDNFSCGQTATGETWCWGINTSGQLGDATHSHRLVPVQVGVSLAVATVDVTPGTASLTAGRLVPLAATPRGSGGAVLTGRIITWTTSDSSIASIGANGVVMAFGTGTATITATSEGVSGMATVTVTVGAPSATATGLVSAGYVHTCAIRAGFHPWCWGFAGSGYLLGAGFQSSYNVPDPVTTTLQFTQVSAGYDATCGLTVDSLAYCWGSAGSGQLGNNSQYGGSSPGPVLGGLKFVQIRLGWRTACALTAAGDVYCWGWDDGRIAGYSSTYFGYSTVVPTPRQIVLPEPMGDLANFGNHACALGVSGTVYCWGSYDAGSTGAGGGWPPNPVAGAPTSIGITVGKYDSCALDGSGDAWCWGYSNRNSLGRSTPGVENPAPGLVDGGRTFAAVYAGNDFGCGLQADGAAYCWGANGSGQLGTGDTMTAPAPVPVSGGLTFTALTLGESHACGVTTAGQLYCWGRNAEGQLGDATYTVRLTPTLIP